MYWFKIKENGYEYSIYSQNYMINNEYRKYTIRILYTYLQPKKQNICDGDGAVEVGLFYCWWLVSVWIVLISYMLTKIWTVGDNKGRVDTIVINNKSKIIFLNNSTFYAEATKQNTICVHVHIILFAVLVYLRRSSHSVNPTLAQVRIHMQRYDSRWRNGRVCSQSPRHLGLGK